MLCYAPTWNSLPAHIRSIDPPLNATENSISSSLPTDGHEHIETQTDTRPQSVPTLAQRRAGNWLVHLQVSIMGNMRKTRCRAKPNVSTLAACVQRISSVDKTDRNSLPWQRPLRDRKTNFRLFISSQSSTNSENLAKIGPVVIL